MELVIIFGCKSKKYFEKTKQVETNDKPKKYILRGERNVRYHDRILSKKNEILFFRD